MADESFYGATLSGAGSKITWEVGYNEEDVSPHEQKLIIKQILLGAEAKQDEYNVVEVQTTKDSVKIPIAVLKAGETRALYPKIEFFDSSVTFKLIQGSGPVYLHGQVIKDVVEVVDWEGDESDEDDDEDEEDEQPKKKQKVENNSTNAKHKKK